MYHLNIICISLVAVVAGSEELLCQPPVDLDVNLYIDISTLDIFLSNMTPPKQRTTHCTTSSSCKKKRQGRCCCPFKTFPQCVAGPSMCKEWKNGKERKLRCLP